MKKLIAFAALSALFLQMQAQTISGRVTSKTDGKPLPGASIIVQSTKAGVQAGANGEFEIQLEKGKTYQLTATFVGFEPMTKTVVVQQNTVVNFDLEVSNEWLEQVNVTALRAGDNSPMAHQDLNKEDIEERNQGQDMPYILEQTTSIVTTSDAGAGVGYTGMRIRGSDQTRINVTINGIPVNDAESHGVFWVNTPDLASSLQSVQIQRGVGTSTNGSGAFGASINMQTDDLQKEGFGKARIGMGSFNTQRYSVQFGSGLINDHWAIQGRLSQIKSDGYVDRARSNLRSYFFTGGYLAEDWSLKAVVFGGNEETYQAWYGLDSATFVSDPTYNYAGLKYDTAGNVVGSYDDQVDNYSQNHYQLHYNKRLSNSWSFNLSGHYTRGRGYYEEYQSNDSLGTYGISAPEIYGNIVRRLWLDNDFYGVVYNLQYHNDKFNFVFGGAANEYLGDHFGEIVWAQYTGGTEPADQFYFSKGSKRDLNFYAKADYNLTSSLSVFGDLQYRRVTLMGKGDDEMNRTIDFKDEFNFVNPKAGITYNVNSDLQIYGSFAISNREPTRQDYIENSKKPKAENLQDIEIGSRYVFKQNSIEVNLYGMFYQNQLVQTGEINNVGYPIRSNVGKSHRIGVELTTNFKILEKLRWMPNLTISRNRNESFTDDDLVNYGETPIAFSPNVIGGSVLEFKPLAGFTMALQNKYVGEQYLSNTGLDRHILNDYFLTNIRMAYQIPVKFVKNLEVEILMNNITNEKYAANGYVYFGDPYYYAQAGFNFLAGLSVDF